MVMEIREIELDFKDGVVGFKSAKGIFKKSKHFSMTTDKIIHWAELELDYMGG